MPASERDRGNTAHVLSVRVDPSLYEIIAAEAAKLGLSVADVCRMRLRTGSIAAATRIAPYLNEANRSHSRRAAGFILNGEL